MIYKIIIKENIVFLKTNQFQIYDSSAGMVLLVCIIQVVSFDGSTTVSEFISSLEKAVGVRDASSSGFSLCSDDPVDSSREIWLLPDAKVLKIACHFNASIRLDDVM